VNRPVTTIKQIADATGVHPSTVSRALDPKKRHLVAEDVAKRITAQAETLGYQPNRLAANLRLGRSDLIGVLLPDIANPVFAPILGGITEVLSAQRSFLRKVTHQSSRMLATHRRNRFPLSRDCSASGSTA
jgi:LacI family transcriptional regulator